MKFTFKLMSLVLLTLVFLSCENEQSDSFIFNESADLQSLKQIVLNQTNQKRIVMQNKSTELQNPQAEEMLKPIINETVSILLNSGIKKSEIVDEFGNLNSPELAIMGVALISQAETQKDTEAKAGDALDCAARAFIGIELHEGFWGSFTNRRVLLRAVGKLATRTLGFIGAALIVYDFADCMWG